MVAGTAARRRSRGVESSGDSADGGVRGSSVGCCRQRLSPDPRRLHVRKLRQPGRASESRQHGDAPAVRRRGVCRVQRGSLHPLAARAGVDGAAERGDGGRSLLRVLGVRAVVLVEAEQPGSLRRRPGAGAEDRRQSAPGARDRLWARLPDARTGRPRASLELAARGDRNVDRRAGTERTALHARRDQRHRHRRTCGHALRRRTSRPREVRHPGLRQQLPGPDPEGAGQHQDRQMELQGFGEPARAGEPLHRQRHHRFAAAPAGSSRAGRAAVRLLRAGDRPHHRNECARRPPDAVGSGARARASGSSSGDPAADVGPGQHPSADRRREGPADRLCARAAGQRDPRRANHARVRRRDANVA